MDLLFLYSCKILIFLFRVCKSTFFFFSFASALVDKTFFLFTMRPGGSIPEIVQSTVQCCLFLSILAVLTPVPLILTTLGLNLACCLVETYEAL